jgi:hypothetical protein
MKIVSSNGPEVQLASHTPEIENRRDEVRPAIEEMEALRASLPKVGVTVDDILEMRHESHKD